MSRQVALIGTGMIGGSLMLALKQAGVVGRVVGFDTARPSADRAAARGMVDAVAADAAAAVRDADLVVLAVPVRGLAGVLETIAPALAGAPATVVTDVGSTKVDVLAAVERFLPFPERFVGAHPIAGTERSGPDAADAALFRGRRCLVTPTPTTRPDAVAAVTGMWEAAGAQVERINAALHDRVLAWVSHLPHAVAFALAAAVGQAASTPDPTGEGVRGLSGGGFIDTTRIAASDPAMWRDIFLANRDALLVTLERLDEELGALRRAVAAGDGRAIEALIDRARQGRQRVIGDRGTPRGAG